MREHVSPDYKSGALGLYATVPPLVVYLKAGESPGLTNEGDRQKIHTKPPFVLSKCIGDRFPGLGPFARLASPKVF